MPCTFRVISPQANGGVRARTTASFFGFAWAKPGTTFFLKVALYE
jgi:hypothetical protein